DDAGGSLEDLEAIIALGRPVTVAVLPGLRYSREVAERAAAAGLEVFLHLPLEPEDSAKALGPGGITVAMSDREIEASVRASLASVPGAIGVNNHMGSRGTADPRVMRAVLSVVRERKLVFVDSVTSPRTVAARIAAEMGVRTAARHVFLDNEDEPTAIRRQLRRVLARARRSGEAVAIGHASRLTAQVLREMLGEFDSAGVVLVPASALVR
ncbi:MAG TPA: divergent polysaccharide deacetylase family protein, partial [bacterium]|nr:divergent polysaccharide deacetylase family protein [bacterium]